MYTVQHTIPYPWLGIGREIRVQYYSVYTQQALYNKLNRAVVYMVIRSSSLSACLRDNGGGRGGCAGSGQGLSEGQFTTGDSTHYRPNNKTKATQAID